MANRPLLLNLFCGAGGAAMGYHRAGFDVLGVDLQPQPRYPFEFIQADAPEYLRLHVSALPELAVIHASPPCQRYSQSSTRWNGKAETHPDLVGPIRQGLLQTGLPYVIENVVGAPLFDPIRLCGSSFGLGVRRHRLFECSWELVAPDCDHLSQPPRFRIYDHGRWYVSRVAHVFGHGGGKSKGDWAEAMGIDWMTLGELAQAIPPVYTEWIGRQLLRHLERVA